MNYSEAQIYMESLERWGSTMQPDGIGKLCRRLGSPMEKATYIHAAGVKGAAAAFVASVLRCAGIKTGRFLPVEGAEYGEQIRMGRRRITKAAFSEGVELIKAACDEMISDGYACPDVRTAMKALAFWYFDREDCQVAVLEEQIIVRGELSGLFAKDGVQLGECAEGLRELSLGEYTEHVNTLWGMAEPAEASHIRYGLERQSFDYKNYKKMEISLAGKGQIENALLAIETIEGLRTAGVKISDKALYQGLREATWPCCFEILHKKPFFVLDGADTGENAREIAGSIELYFDKKRIIYIVGMLKSSEADKVISRTAKYANMILTVTPQHPQAVHAYELARKIAGQHPNVTAVDSLEEAVEISFLIAGKEDVIIAFGTPALQGRLTDILDQKAKMSKKKQK